MTAARPSATINTKKSGMAAMNRKSTWRRAHREPAERCEPDDEAGESHL